MYDNQSSISLNSVKLVNELYNEAVQHDAVQHPYLLALSNGEFPNMIEAIKDFSIQYNGYSSWFIKYLVSTISKFDEQKHRDALLSNLSEESGRLDKEEIELLKGIGIQEEWVQGVPHSMLFYRFKEALGVDSKVEPCIEVIMWREMLQSIIVNGSTAEALGAIGLGTECIAKYIYRHLGQAIKKYTDLTQEQYVFFDLHSEIDDEHGEIILNIIRDLIEEDPNNYYDVRKGMLKALALRAMFWNSMTVRSRGL